MLRAGGPWMFISQLFASIQIPYFVLQDHPFRPLLLGPPSPEGDCVVFPECGPGMSFFLGYILSGSESPWNVLGVFCATFFLLFEFPKTAADNLASKVTVLSGLYTFFWSRFFPTCSLKYHQILIFFLLAIPCHTICPSLLISLVLFPHQFFHPQSNVYHNLARRGWPRPQGHRRRGLPAQGLAPPPLFLTRPPTLWIRSESSPASVGEGARPGNHVVIMWGLVNAHRPHQHPLPISSRF